MNAVEKQSKYNYWKEDEIELLEELYPKIQLKDLVYKFPRRNKGTIAVKAKELGISSAKLWQEEEKQKLTQFFQQGSEKELKALFPRRSWAAILAKGERLNLKREQRKPRKQVNESYFRVWSRKMAYVLGFILADGCIIQGTYKGYSDSLKLGVHVKDIDILEKIKKELESEHKISRSKDAVHFSITSQKSAK